MPNAQASSAHSCRWFGKPIDTIDRSQMPSQASGMAKRGVRGARSRGLQTLGMSGLADSCSVMWWNQAVADAVRDGFLGDWIGA